MPYSKIVKIRQMSPAYNIKEAGVDDWKIFIANDQFNEILMKMVRAVRNNDADNHKSLWIAGTYGTGKSHAGSVLQHIFCDPIEYMQDYVETEYKEPKYDTIRTSIMQVRQSKRLFPVCMYGINSINHEEDLSLQIQREVKAALQGANLDLVVKTDFDMYVEHIDNQPQYWEYLIEQSKELKSVAPDLKKLKQRLSDGDTSVLDKVRIALRESGLDIRLQSHNLKQWLLDVQDALRENTVYNGLLIIWDEFTEVMTASIGIKLLVQLQEIAETMMSSENDSYFLFISHPSALNSLKEEEREKTKGRYHYVPYNMEQVSAFKIMSKKFEIQNYTLYMRHQDEFYNQHPELLDLFSQSSTDPDQTRRNIKDLFPLHPGTANLATYYAREAGSSSRSVFEFLANDTVKSFLEDDEKYTQKLTITADYLWDYVRPNFEQETTKFGAVTERYNSHHLAVEAAGENYLRVFKGILLLNALNNIANNDTVTPSYENIKNLFVGTPVAYQLDEVLDFFNDKSIIQRQPNGNFSILFTALPSEEIQQIQERLRTSNFVYTDQVINFGDIVIKSFDNYLAQVARPFCYKFYSLQSNEYTLLNRIESAKRDAQPYEVFLAILVGRNNDEVLQLRDIVENNYQDKRFEQIVFIVMDAPFGDREYDRFIEYQANAQCAQSHGLPAQTKTYTQQACEMLSAWAVKLRSGNATFYLAGDSIPTAGSKLASCINLSIAPKLFIHGPESLDSIRSKSAATYWKKQSARATVDVVLSYNTKQDILNANASKGQARHVEFLLQDSVDDNLQFKSDVDANHPLKLVCEYVDEWLSGKHTNKNTPFNLGDKLIGLTEAPYGLYQSYASMAMVAFAMRKYVNIIFDANGRQRTAQHLVDDVVEIFKAWEAGKTSNKLNFMFESKEAGRLCKNLIKMFKLNTLKGYSDINSLKDARWAINHEYTKEKGYPLWSLKYADECNDDLKTFIENLVKVVSDPESMKNPQLLEATINGYDTLKTDFGNLLLPSVDAFRFGFNKYITSLPIVNIQEDEIDEALEYLHGHMQSEVGLWTEIEVESHLKDWRMLKSQRAQGGQNPTNGSGASSFTPQTPSNPVSPDVLYQKRIDAISRIKNNSNLQGAIERLINSEDSVIIDILLKYV